MCSRRCHGLRRRSSEAIVAVRRERQPNIIDRSVEALIRRVPSAFFRLAEVDVDPASVRPGDVAVNLPEFRADQLFIVGAEEDPGRWAIHLEPRSVLETLFREELQMLKEATFIDEWIQQEIQQGRAEGETAGRAVAARQILLRLLRQRFGELPAAVLSRVESATAEWCEEMAVRVLTAKTLSDLGFQPRATPLSVSGCD
jgi:hypothetical protein